MSDLDERVRACLDAGDARAAAAAVVGVLGPGLCGYLNAVLGNADDAADVFSEVSEAVLAGMAGFRGESAVKTWTYRIAWRTARHFKEDPRRFRERRLATGETSALAEEVRTSTAAYLKTQAKDWLARMRAEMSDDDQSLLTLRLDRDLSWNEVAEVMGDGTPDAAARLRKRYERLKTRLREVALRDGLLGQ